MKVCSSCKNKKSLKEFYKQNKKSDKVQSWCIECFKTRRKGHHNTNRILETRAKRRKQCRELILKYLLKNPCLECGEADPRVLDFNHIDPKTKKYNVASMATGSISKKLIIEEISKCEVLCANCHRIKTSYDSGNFKNSKWAVSLIEKNIGLRNQR